MYVLRGANAASKHKLAKALRTKRASEVSFVPESIYLKKVVCLNTQGYLDLDLYVLQGVNVASKNKFAKALRTKKASEVSFVLEAIYKKGGVFKLMLTFEEQQQNTNTVTQLFVKVFTKELAKHLFKPTDVQELQGLEISAV